MFTSLKNSWDLIKESGRVFWHHPKFLVPLLITWMVYAPVILYLIFITGSEYTTLQILFIVLCVVFLFALILSFSCSMLLELVQQLESGRKPSLIKSFWHTLAHNTVRILPIVLVWTVIWFILIIIQALLSKDKKRTRESFDARNAAKVLAGYGKISISRAFFEALQKGVRMIVFLILPAVAWENLNFIKAIKKGLVVFKVNLSTFVAGFVLTEAAAGLIFLPPTILFILSDKFGVEFSGWVWLLTIIYIAFAWSYSIYLEQMFAAELYLWNYKWEREASRAEQEGRPIPTLKQISHPSLLDEVHELVEKSGI